LGLLGTVKLWTFGLVVGGVCVRRGAARDRTFSLAADRDARNQSGLFTNLLVLYVYSTLPNLSVENN